MRISSTSLAFVAAAAVLAAAGLTHAGDGRGKGGHHDADERVQLGPRPFYLVEGMDESRLKHRLQGCQDGPFHSTDFSIGHRGAALEFPEHSKEAYDAGARMGAGIVECDVTFTKDGELVCRHSECDLHTTTNIVATSLNGKCSIPWTGPNSGPKCCTSDLTLDEFKTLTAKMDASNPSATTPEGYLGGTPSWRTDLYTGRGTLMTLRESVALNEKNGVKHTPELKGGDAVRIGQIFGGQPQYAQKLIDELKDADVEPRRVWLQSFNKADILYWLHHAPEFGRQAVYLDSIDPTATPPVPRQTVAELDQLRMQGGRYFAPPMPALLEVPKQTDIQITSIYLAPDIIPQGKIGTRFSVDMGIKKQIQKSKGELFFNASDIFNTLRIKKEINGNGFKLNSTDYYETQVFRLGYSYKF